MKQKIAYIMSCFPHLPDTFILREVVEMERLGWNVALYPLQQSVTNTPLHSLQLPFSTWTVFKFNIFALSNNPLLYLSLLLQIVSENVGQIYHFFQALTLFPKAVYAAALMQKEGITHVHAYFATQPALAAWIVYRLTGINYSITVHAQDIFGKTSMLATKIKSATFVAATSRGNRQALTKLVGSGVRDKTYVIHHGIIPENYRQKSQRLRLGEKFEILSVSRLQVECGQRHLIEACVSLRERNIPFRCRIVGEGPERPFLETLIRTNQLEDQVELLGNQSQQAVARLFPTAHCYVQPSLAGNAHAGVTIPIMEALASGLPVVATDVAGVCELIRHRETGYLMSPGDSLALAEAVEVLYAIPEHGRQLAARGRELLLKEFELRKNVRSLSNLLEQAVENRHLYPVH